MPKEEWGVKRACPSCSTRFYDLGRDPMTCPHCGHAFTLASLRGGSGRSAVAAGRSDSKGEEPAQEETPVESGESELGDDVLEEENDDKVSLDDIADVDPGDENT